MSSCISQCLMTAKLQHVQLIRDQLSNHIDDRASNVYRLLNIIRYAAPDPKRTIRKTREVDLVLKTGRTAFRLQLHFDKSMRQRLLIMRCQSESSCAGPRTYHCRRPHVRLRMSTPVKLCILCAKLTMKHDRYYTRTKQVCFE